MQPPSQIQPKHENPMFGESWVLVKEIKGIHTQHEGLQWAYEHKRVIRSREPRFLHDCISRGESTLQLSGRCLHKCSMPDLYTESITLEARFRSIFASYGKMSNQNLRSGFYADTHTHTHRYSSHTCAKATAQRRALQSNLSSFANRSTTSALMKELLPVASGALALQEKMREKLVTLKTEARSLNL